MSETAVANASPLIYLARTKLLHLLQLAAPEALIIAKGFGRRSAPKRTDP